MLDGADLAAGAMPDVTVPANKKRRRCYRPKSRCGAVLCCCGCCVCTTLVVILVVFAITLAVEANAVANAPDTAHFYNVDAVCGKTASGLTTRSSVSEALSSGDTIQHCGDCGECSSDHDINVMRVTADNLTRTATRCAVRVFLGGEEGVSRCFETQVGFSPSCSRCWVENVLCDQQKCVATCLWGIIRGEPNNRDAAPDELSSCLKCDERLCGPAFVTCAGANRRRAGIVTDIGRRDAVELCSAASATE